jgi:hypothetical protein
MAPKKVPKKVNPRLEAKIKQLRKGLGKASRERKQAEGNISHFHLDGGRNVVGGKNASQMVSLLVEQYLRVHWATAELAIRRKLRKLEGKLPGVKKESRPPAPEEGVPPPKTPRAPYPACPWEDTWNNSFSISGRWKSNNEGG